MLTTNPATTQTLGLNSASRVTRKASVYIISRKHPARLQATVGSSTTETVELGKSGLQVSSIGIGAWSWGDRSGYWGYGSDYGKDDTQQAYKGLLDAGVTLIDTAEVYGFGKSEEFLGEFMQDSDMSPVISTKFAPLPWRQTADSVPMALGQSLRRLKMDKVGHYMIHWPGFFLNAFANDAYIEGLAKCVNQGLTETVGVSNFKEDRLRSAHRVLGERGIPLASNQVQYSLLYRNPEKNGVLDACRDLGITLMAYSPLCQGLLTGKYTPENPPKGQRNITLKNNFLKEIQPLLSLMREIGSNHDGKTPAQIAINWALCKGVLPIPGAKNAKQVEEIIGALGWRMTDEEVSALDSASDKLPMSTGAPFENW